MRLIRLAGELFKMMSGVNLVHVGRGVPPRHAAAIVERLNREINAGRSDPAINAGLADIGTVPRIFSPQEFGTFVAAENEKRGKVIAAPSIKAE